MRATQYDIASRAVVRCLCLAGSMAMALALAGCSAASMTGFEFPVFGLNEKSAEGNDAPQSATQTEANPAFHGAGQQQLTTQ